VQAFAALPEAAALAAANKRITNILKKDRPKRIGARQAAWMRPAAGSGRGKKPVCGHAVQRVRARPSRLAFAAVATSPATLKTLAHLRDRRRPPSSTM
jgi:glycyl-tRNA synthetase beta chain